MDAGAQDAGVPPAADPATAVRATIAGLRALLAGELPDDLDPQSLFEVDLLDEVAIAARIRQLRAARGELPDGGPSTPDAGAAADATPPDAAWPDADRAEAGAGGADAGIALAPPDGGWPDAGAPDAGAPRSDLEALTAERDRLRLRFLDRPADERAAVVRAVRERRRIAVSERASEAEEARARAEAQRATEARDDALSAAARTPSAIERDLLAERARVETARAELARWVAAQAARRRRYAQASAERLRWIHAVELDLGSLGPEEADERYDGTVDQLQRERGRLAVVLSELGAADRQAPDLSLEMDLDAVPYRRAEARDEVLAAHRAFEGARARAVAEEERSRWERADKLAADLRALDRLRLSLLGRLSRGHREDVMGWGAVGRDQLQREVRQAQLMFGYWARHAWHAAPEVPTRFGQLFLRTGSRTDLLLIALWIVGVVVLWRRRDSVTERLRRWVMDRQTIRRWRGLIRPFWSVIGPLLVPLMLVVALHVLFALMSDIGESLALDAARIVSLRVAWFYVLAAAVGRFFVSRLRHGAARSRSSRRIIGSVRVVIGFALAVVLATDLSELIVGRGYIHHLVVDVAWLGAFPIVAWLVHRWADDVCEAHSESHPEGFVARALSRKDSGLRRRVLTIAAAPQLAVSAVVSAVRELALRFEQFRRAFAFLFRRRLERRIETKVDEQHAKRLPGELLETFREVPSDPELEIDHFPGMDGVIERLAEFAKGARGFSVALVGERGIGKTTWMRELIRRAALDSEIYEVPHRLIDPPSICLWLSEILGLEATRDVQELSAALRESEARRVIFLDQCQNLVVRAIGGTVGLETLYEIATHTADRVVWVCSFARYTWLYLERNRQGQDLFTIHVKLESWDEEDIAALVRRRMEAAGVQASFRDLVVQELRGSALEDAILRTEGEYLRLLWDFSEGNPRVAIHYWLHSLVTQDELLRVRLFAAPDAEDLEKLHEESRFLLATIALHENATVEEAAASLGISQRHCAALLTYLRSHHYVQVHRGQWRISTHWYRPVIRYLRRRRLLFD